MKNRILIYFLLSVTLAFAQNGDNPNADKIVNIHKVENAPEIDGVIDPLWNDVESVELRHQQSPFYGQDPTYRTEVKIVTTVEALYCIIVCYDDGKVQAIKGTLDNVGGDNVSLMLDTFGNGRTAYKFAVMASGVRSDCWLLDDARNRDYNWDGIWFADAKVHDWGWVAEIKVPYKSIQYDPDLMAWGLDIDRYIARKGEDIYWCEYDEGPGQRVSKFGKLAFNGFRPTVRGLHLELYPVGIAKAEYLEGGKYKITPNAGLDIMYNPSAKLTFQLTANPDFAQIEADPFDFNISRYESYFSERRPFFTEGHEIFMPAGRQRNMGFYRPLELFYSRRIGRKLPDGGEVPLWAGAKAFGRVGKNEYGGFFALTGEKEYTDNDSTMLEEQAYFGSVRLNRQIFGNSSLGILFVGKYDANGDNAVLDIDGAIRGESWQLAYQFARSFRNNEGDYAGSLGFTRLHQKMILGIRARYIGENFDIADVGFVPWTGTAQIFGFGGPRWYFEEGTVSSIMIYGGPFVSYEKIDDYTDYGGVLGFNMQFRPNYGYEINLEYGRSKEENVIFDRSAVSFSSWGNVRGAFFGNVFGQYAKEYNFSRDYLGYFTMVGSMFRWDILPYLNIGTTFNMFVEGDPDGVTEDITYNARPYVSATPFNNFNIRFYVDNVWTRNTGKLQQLIGGFLLSYNFSPKSWIYFALNDVEYRPEDRLTVLSRAAVVKIRYLYYM